jgi:hypothetical protein
LTFVEIMIALFILSVGMLGYITVSMTALKENEINRQLKLSIFDCQSVLEGLAGTPFREICDTTYAANTGTAPQFPQGDQNLAGILKGPAHLLFQRISVYYYKSAAGQAAGNAYAQPPVEVNGVAQASVTPPTACTATDLATPPDPLWVTITCAWESSPGITSSYSIPFMITNTLDSSITAGSGP